MPQEQAKKPLDLVDLGNELTKEVKGQDVHGDVKDKMANGDGYKDAPYQLEEDDDDDDHHAIDLGGDGDTDRHGNDGGVNGDDDDHHHIGEVGHHVLGDAGDEDDDGDHHGCDDGEHHIGDGELVQDNE